MTILVVDDHSVFRGTVAGLLKFSGHAPLCAANGKEGLRIIAEQAVDVIITDVLMPEIDGLEFIEQVRETHPFMPIVAISGGGRTLEKTCCLKIAKFFGATIMISKPFVAEELLTAIGAAVAQSKDAARVHQMNAYP